MVFNRYDVLFNHYQKEISSWKWGEILQSLTDYEPEGFDPDYDDPLVGAWLGSVMAVFPSGKIYAPWTTNQTRADVVRDECFSEALEAVAGRHGVAVDYFDGSIFVVRPKATA